MSQQLVVILDDRDPPADSVRAALGELRFSDILRRRRTMASELRAIAEAAGADAVEHLTEDAAAHALAERIRDRGEGAVYLRLPLCLPPLSAEGLAALAGKARYALGPMLASAVMGDEAATVLPPADAAALLSAEGPEARRAALLALRERADSILDHARFVDIRDSRNLMLYLTGATEVRHFNAASSEGRVFRKSSADSAKMRAEHGYYHAAAPELQRFLLPTWEMWEKDGRAGYAMEYLPIPDAALQWVHGAMAPQDFETLLDQIFDFLRARPAGQVDAAAARAQILGKLETRMEAFLASPVGRKVDASLAAAGPHGGLSAMMDRARPLIEGALKRTADRPQVFSHGDPCFSNILFDRRIGLMRLIDPRGAIAPGDAMMHPLYDLAKVSHSALGGYDFVNNGRFRVSFDGALTLRLDWTEGGPPDWAARMFRARLDAEGWAARDVRAVELSLFLSMLPLHTDHPDKLLGFALIAGSILDDLDG